MNFEVKRLDGGGRLGVIKHNNKTMLTPNLFPVVSPMNNLIAPQEIIDIFQGSAVFTNAYIMYKNSELRNEVIKSKIHQFLNFNGLIATDSGAFQHYMYGQTNDITADEIESFQEQIESDFPVILDLPVQMEDSWEMADSKVSQTITRAKMNVARRLNKNLDWFCPIHGGLYLDLIKKSCLAMNELDFGYFAIGGVVKTLNDYMFDYSLHDILTAKRYLRPDRPLHLFGSGLPQFFALSVACGVDTMDSAAYILFAKEGRYMTVEGTRLIEDLVELPCSCPICVKYTQKEIYTLFKDSNKENSQKGVELLARHNLYVSFKEIKTIREAIRSGNLWELVEQRIHAHPRLIRAYRQIPKYWPQLELNEPSEKTKAMFFFDSISQSRPIFFRILKNIYHNYNSSNLKRLILIPELDCSIYNSPTTKGWLSKIEEYNKIMVEKKDKDKCYEVLIISNIFGPIPYQIAPVYPLTQREWINNYKRTNFEVFSLLSYCDIKTNNILFDPNEIKIHQKLQDYIINDKRELEFEDFTFSNKIDISYDYIINRIELVIQFLLKNTKQICEICIIRPDTILTEDNYEKKFESHLIDDIISILQCKKVLNPEIKIKVYQNIEQLEMR